MLPDDLSEEFSPLFFKEERDAELWRLIKAADKLSAYIKCIEERKAGNCEFEDAERTIRKALDESECREAHIFLEDLFLHTSCRSISLNDCFKALFGKRCPLFLQKHHSCAVKLKFFLDLSEKVC